MAGCRKGDMPLMFQEKIRIWEGCRGVMGREGREGARAGDGVAFVADGVSARRRRLDCGGLIGRFVIEAR